MGNFVLDIEDLELRSRVESSGVVKRCKLKLVVLAGLEWLKKTATDGSLRSESAYINRSRSYVEQALAKARRRRRLRRAFVAHSSRTAAPIGAG